MASGIKRSCNRPKLAKHLRSGAKKKRYRNTTEAQAKYHAAIAARRAKKDKRKKRMR